MKMLAVLVHAAFVVVAMTQTANEAEVNRIKAEFSTSLAEDHEGGMALLRQKIAEGTALEKDAAISLAEEQTVLELVPALLDAVTDTTTAPRYDDTGWGFIGRHAGWAIGGIIIKVDRRWIQKKGADSHLDLMDFFNDEDRPRLQRALCTWWKGFKRRGGDLSQRSGLGIYRG